MISFILAKYKKSNEFVQYFVLTYIDKIISFALPLSILFVFKDKALYSILEVAYSYATIIMIVIDMGFSGYLFFGFKNSKNKEEFLKNAQLFFKFLLLSYSVLLLFIFLTISYFNIELISFGGIIAIRTLYILVISFYSNFYRLKDQPSKIYLSTLAINLLSFSLLAIAHSLSLPHEIYFFFIPQLLAIMAIITNYTFNEIRLFNYKKFKFFLHNTLSYSWPIILNILTITYINNYGKIYAYKNLSEQEMVQISYIMRIGLVIQLTHSAFATYFSKSLFMNEKNQFDTVIFKKYNITLFFSFLFAISIISLTNFIFNTYIYIPLSISTYLFILYILMWCYIGYLEMYFNIMNSNIKILKYSLVSLAFYSISLNLYENVDLLKISLSMVLSALLNLILVLVGLWKMKLFITNTAINNYE